MLKKACAITLMSIALIGCNTNMGPNEQTATWVGAITGGVVGAHFGSGTGHFLGAAIGAAAGALAGNVVGQQMDD